MESVTSSILGKAVDGAIGSVGGPLSSAQSSITIASSKSRLPDITSLDIKNSVVSSRKQSVPEEIDFFQDMEPVISKPKLLHLDDLEREETPTDSKPTLSCFDVDLTANAVTGDVGWDDNEDWGDISDAELPKS